MTQAHEEAASLLLVDDDATFCQVLRRALEKRGFAVTVAHSVERALPLAQARPPQYAVVDLKMGGASGLTLVKALHELNPAARIVMLTGYASIATAVEAVKLGATQYLSKPANADEIVAAFGYRATADVQLEAQALMKQLAIRLGYKTTSAKPLVMPLDRLEWEHIQRVLREQHNNISSAARALNMHRCVFRST